MQTSRSTDSVAARHGFTVLELLLSVSIMTVIVIGLYTVFDQTQRALRHTIAQTDVQEGIRATSDLMVRDFQAAAPVSFSDTNLTSLAVGVNRYSIPVSLQDLKKGPDPLLNTLIQDVYLVTRQNDFWKSVGYWVAPSDTNAIAKDPFFVGRLYRFAYETNGTAFAHTDLYRRYWDVQNHFVRLSFSQPVMDGVVYLRVLAYDAAGNPLAYNDRNRPLFFDRSSDSWADPRSWFIDPLRDEVTAYRFRRGSHPQFPARIELVIGIVEPQTATRLAAIPVPAEARKFLARNAGKIHIFRHLITLRNSPPS